MADAKKPPITQQCCVGCGHREDAAPGDHCYMFHDAPDTYCAQHTKFWPALISRKAASTTALLAVMATLGATRQS